MSSALVFRSKVDTFVLILLATGVVACGYAAFEVAGSVQQMGVIVSGVVIGLCGIGGVVPLWILLSTRYLLGDASLDIRCGPFRWIVPLKDIETIERTRDLLSSPALSLDRLHIVYGAGRKIMISPENRDAFLMQIEARRKA